MAVLVGWFSGSLSLSLFLIPLVNSALATVSSGFRIRLFFVVHTQKKETTHWIMEWNESFVFSVFIHFNKSLNFSQPCQLMKASLFFSLCAYQFFLLLLFFRHFVFFCHPHHSCHAAFDCLESQDGAVSAFAFFHPNPYAGASVIMVQTETN